MSLRRLAEMAMPLMTPAQRAEAERLLHDLAQPSSTPAQAFERGMQPVSTALAEALQAGDLDALKGFRAMMPELMRQVNADDQLADALTQQLWREVFAGLKAKPSDLL